VTVVDGDVGAGAERDRGIGEERGPATLAYAEAFAPILTALPSPASGGRCVWLKRHRSGHPAALTGCALVRPR
jgi:hypothetical protein